MGNPPLETLAAGAIHDDKPPHIDDYGLGMLEALSLQVGEALEQEDDPQCKGILDQIWSSVEAIANRYRET